MNGQNRPILPPAGWVSAAMNRQRPPAMVNRLPMIILVISSGSRRLRLHHFQKAATATSIEKLNDRIERDQPAGGQRCSR